LSLCFDWAPRHEGVLGEWRYSSTHSLTPTLDGGEWSASRSRRFTPRERAPGNNGNKVGWAPEPFWARWWREKFPTPAGNRNLEAITAPNIFRARSLKRLGYRLGGRGSNSGNGWEFFSSPPSLEPTQPPIQWYRGFFPQG